MKKKTYLPYKTSAQMLRSLFGTHLALALLCLGALISAQNSAETQNSTLLSQTEIADQVVQKTNEFRSQMGLPYCTPQRALTQAGVNHSNEMLTLRYFSHQSPNSRNARHIDRVRQAGGTDVNVSENIYLAQKFPSNKIADKAVRAFKNSPSHRKNLVNRNFNQIGVGVATDGSSYYVTQVFSHKAIDIIQAQSKRISGGVRVRLKCEVIAGTRRGAVFFNGRSIARWQAQGDGHFTTEFDLPGRGNGLLQLGQESSRNRFDLDTHIQVPDTLAKL